jgi:Transglutaminase-like superfamily
MPRLALRRRVRSWRRLSGWTKLGIVIGTVTHPLAVLLVRVVPFRFYRRLTTDGPGQPVDQRAHDLARGMVIAGKRSPLRVRCLAESVMTATVLRALGYASRVVIGIKRPDESFGAHAWVEVGGTIVGNAGSTATGFQTLDLANRTWRA